MLKADLHTHSPLCKHATGEPEEYVQCALERGINVLGVSDHAPMRPEPFDDWRMLADELPEYFLWVERAKNSARGEVEVLLGLECDWVDSAYSWNEKLAGDYAWDYLIGSVHYLGKKFDFDNPKWLEKWSSVDVEELWKDYWRRYTEMVKSEIFQIMGHPDLIKKFGFRPDGDLNRFYEPVVEALVDSGASIEINTAGWHKPCAEQYPSLDFLRLSQEGGVTLTVNSDAHSPEEVGRDRSKAVELARLVGYDSLVLYRGREKVTVPLG